MTEFDNILALVTTSHEPYKSASWLEPQEKKIKTILPTKLAILEPSKDTNTNLSTIGFRLAMEKKG